MTQTIIEMAIEPGAEVLLLNMGKTMGTRARSTIMDRAVSHIRDAYHITEVTAWFSEPRFAPARRTTLRLSPDNADWLAALAATVGKSRPLVLLDLAYFAAANLDKGDLEAA